MLKKYYSLLIISAFLIFASTAGHAANLHAIMIGDTHDTWIGNQSALDLRNVSPNIDKIASYTNLSLKKKVFSGSEFRSDKVLNHLTNLKIARDDVVIFYYSGHGFRTPEKDKSSLWPALHFTSSRYSLDLHSVVKIINDKKPRFSLIVADCCNAYESSPYAPLYKGLTKVHVDKSIIAKNCRKLFLESRGSIIASSSEAGQYSYCDEGLGGWYTHSFLNSINHWMRQPSSPNWYQILDTTYSNLQGIAKRYGIIQTPLQDIKMKN